MSYVPLERYQRCFRDIQASYKLGIKSGSYKRKFNAKDYFPARLVYVYAGGRGPFDLMVTGSGGDVEWRLISSEPFDDGLNKFGPFGYEKEDGVTHPLSVLNLLFFFICIMMT